MVHLCSSRTSSASEKHVGPIHRRGFHPPPLSAALAYCFRSSPAIRLRGHPRLWARSGAEGTRTPCLYSAIVALSQLSYSPADKREYIQNGPKCQTSALLACRRVPDGNLTSEDAELTGSMILLSAFSAHSAVNPSAGGSVSVAQHLRRARLGAVDQPLDVGTQRPGHDQAGQHAVEHIQPGAIP